MSDDPNYTGSRDEMRKRLDAVMKALGGAVEEVHVLRAHHKNHEYRETDAHIGMAICSIQLAMVAMRKRKLKANDPPAEEVPETTKEVIPV